MSKTKTVWHPYPDEKPRRANEYLITLKKIRRFYVTTDYYDIKEGDFENEFCSNIVAWAEMPRPFEPEEKK